MIITAIAYGTEDETMLKVTTSDTGVMQIANLEANDPNRTWPNDVVDAWLAIEGNTITAWVDPVDYMAKMRAERDQLLAAIDWRVLRNYTQVAHSETPTDADMTTIYAYQKDLRDFPADNPITTKAQYDALTWPVVPE